MIKRVTRQEVQKLHAETGMSLDNCRAHLDKKAIVDCLAEINKDIVAIGVAVAKLK